MLFKCLQASMNVLIYLIPAEVYDNLIGFVTKVDDNDSKGKDIEKIDGVSRYGVLLKINKTEISGYKPSENGKVYRLNLFGLTFARFRIISMKPIEGLFIASVEIFQDEIAKEVEANIERKKLLINLKK